MTRAGMRGIPAAVIIAAACSAGSRPAWSIAVILPAPVRDGA